MIPPITEIHENAIDITETTKHVPTTLDRNILWLVGHMATLSTIEPENPKWTLWNIRLSIRPGESGRQAYKRETGEELDKYTIIYVIDC